MQNAVSLNSALMTSARIFGPALAGLLIVTVGYGWCFAVDGISYIAVIIGLLLMRTNELRSSPVAAKAKGQVRAGLRYARSKPDLWVPLVMMAIIGTLTFNFNVIIPCSSRRRSDGTDTDVHHRSTPSSPSVRSPGRCVDRAAHDDRGSRRRRGRGRDLRRGDARVRRLARPGSPSPSRSSSASRSIPFMTASTAIVQMRAEPEMRGRVLALQAIVFLGQHADRRPAARLDREQFGPRAAVLIGGVSACFAALWGILVYRRRRGSLAADEPRPEPDDVQVPEPA